MSPYGDIIWDRSSIASQPCVNSIERQPVSIRAYHNNKNHQTTQPKNLEPGVERRIVKSMVANPLLAQNATVR